MSGQNDLSADFVRTLFEYDAMTGDLIWKRRTEDGFIASKGRSVSWICNKWNATWAGKVAGNKTEKGYIRIRINGKKYSAARVIWLIINGVWPENQIDHKDGKRARNVAENLRDATPSQNAENRRIRKTNRYGHPGISRQKNRWRAELCSKGQRFYLGMFVSKEAAINAYVEAKSIHHRFQPEIRKA